MARHRNVRSMNYNDEYDGYDDVYGHSVEDEYCVSPSDEAQFMYDRTRQPQISAFLNEQDNITEEDENVGKSTDRNSSDCFIHPALSDIDEAKLLSCLEEIRNVIGDSISERILVETVMKCDFNVNKSLDTILSNATSSSMKPMSDDPKPQRVRKDREIDFVNSSNDFLGLANYSENIKIIDLKKSGQVFCGNPVYFNKSVEVAGGHSYNKLKIKSSNFASSSSTPECIELNVCCTNISRSSDKDHNDSEVLQSKNPCLSLLPGGTKGNVQIKGEMSMPLNADTSDLLRQSDVSLGVCSSNKPMDHAAFAPNYIVPESKTDLFSDEDDFGSSPLTVLQKKIKNVLDDQCQSLKNLIIQDCGVESSDNWEQRNEKMSKVMRWSEMCKIHQVSSAADDSKEEEKDVFPLAALASRVKHKNIESEPSGSQLESLDSVFSNMLTFSNYRERDLDEQDERQGVQKIKSLYEERRFSHDKNHLNVTPSNESSSDDGDGETFSPLAALADRYHKEKDGSRLKNSKVENEDESSEKMIQTICNCKLESEGYSAYSCSRSCGAFDETCEGKNLPTSGRTVFEKENGSVPETKVRGFDLIDLPNRSASSLSDLAFFHLTRSSSCSSKSGHKSTNLNKSFSSDSRISKSVPGSFVIPFLKQKEEERIGDTTVKQMEVQEGSVSDAGAESPDEWVIDLSSAIRDPGSEVSYDVPEDESCAKVMDIQNADVEEDNEHVISVVPSQLDSSGILKMKFSYTKRKCTSFGRVLCRQWRALTRPYLPPPKQVTGTVIRFSFSTKSPDDTVLFHLRRK